ncbi:MAG: hypothetical protein H7A51_01930 [Akkermansiaceae bacterium]|nr:hypothetical protein [Akkermansiaceae bacterium]
MNIKPTQKALHGSLTVYFRILVDRLTIEIRAEDVSSASKKLGASYRQVVDAKRRLDGGISGMRIDILHVASDALTQ